MRGGAEQSRRNRLAHSLLVAIGCLVSVLDARLAPVRAFGQEQTKVTVFDVASIRRSESASTPMSVTTTPGRFTATSIDLKNLVTVAYRLPWFRIINVPDWPERYDVVASMPSGVDVGQLGAMLQSLLTERFMMRAHMETRDQPVYALVMARNDGCCGPQLQRADVDCAVVLAARATPAGATAQASALDPCDDQVRTLGHVVIRGMSLDALANYLSGAARDRVVVNRTGLEGNFDLELRFELPDSGSTVSAGEFPSLFGALEEQLGLKLEPQRGPVEVLVIDSIDRPSAN